MTVRPWPEPGEEPEPDPGALSDGETGALSADELAELVARLQDEARPAWGLFALVPGSCRGSSDRSSARSTRPPSRSSTR